MDKTDAQRPNKKFILTLLFLGYLVSYIDRLIMNIAVIPIGEEFQLSPTATGTVISIFFLSYAIMQIPGGWLTDRFGARKVIIFSIFIWSIFTGLTGLAWSAAALIAIRFLFGLGEGGYPAACGKAIAENFPKGERGKAQSILMSSNLLGGVITPLLATPLLIWLGWRHLFLAIGVAGILIGFLFWKYIQMPSQPAESSDPVSSDKGRLFVLLRSPQMWKLLLLWLGISMAGWGMTSWMPTYMVNVRHLDLVSAGMLGSIPALAGVLATMAGGWLLGWFAGKEKLYLVGNAGLFALFLMLTFFAPSIGLVYTYSSIATVFFSFIFSAVYALPHEMFNKSVIGSAIGLVTFGSVFAGFIAPIIMGVLITAFKGSYIGAFTFLTICVCISILIGLTLKNDLEFSKVEETDALEA
ncbi:MAG: MFS transporter [Bacillota bacterium]